MKYFYRRKGKYHEDLSLLDVCGWKPSWKKELFWFNYDYGIVHGKATYRLESQLTRTYWEF